MESVKEILCCKESLEKKHRSKAEKLGWDRTDVLYSFRGLYVIGLIIYYSDKIRCEKYEIRTPENKNAYSRKFIFDKYKDFALLNEVSELKAFIKIYDTIGNIIPI